MDTIKNIVIFDGSLELPNPDLDKFDRSKAIVNKVLRFLRNRDSNIIDKINKENAVLYINRYSGEWKIKNASNKLINRIFG
ncbi:hypothetical protein [Wenyingzhuangia aestuarii]|uniref:hypothetical protein n=1 Tax=Wenyingzhuangia aestuarii TaxID=1647582 RepID=UPI001438FAEC|nr:hypothetical protein [Wenyingzhuangia aestuarii]NJB81886.1 hypothetical protein [Wenyingzhuangia aestuarii]